ncbi:AMP-binding protein, partial [Bacillus sp. S1-R4H1-FB]|uniref:AMP-binding protein n=1 Tax=Bacillus sp. S1-R4H1-FB TaxID=1973492 RepID=UPI00111CAAF4
SCVFRPLYRVVGIRILIKKFRFCMRNLRVLKYDVDFIHKVSQTRGVTIISVVSTMLTDLLARLGEGTYPSSLRCMLLGGGRAPKPLLETCVDKGIPVYRTYGMTVTSSQLCTLSADSMLTKVGSAGKPLFQCQLRVENDGVVVAPYAEGEVGVRGRKVTGVSGNS